MRICSRCKQNKPVDDFYKMRRRGRVESQRICKKCSKEYLDKWRVEHPEAIKASDRKKVLKTRYGMTIDDYNHLLAQQNNGCGVCGKPERTIQRKGSPIQFLAVDHDHEAGKVRGLLCQPCNRALGNMGDNLEGVMRFVRYLQQPHYEPHGKLPV